MILKDYKFNKSWTLFLDRDGVINKKINNDYVLIWKQFEFIQGVTEAIKILSSVFGKIIIVTNQQGIGRGLMTEKDLSEIHSKMIAEIEKYGGRIDAIYYSPYISENNHVDRKPNVGMALKARKDFPEINFKKTVMAGDSISDMEFGHRLGMINVLINKDKAILKKNPELINFAATDLKDFSLQIKNILT
jgi:histidinol-phosphate phosphatase family protein